MDHVILMDKGTTHEANAKRGAAPLFPLEALLTDASPPLDLGGLLADASRPPPLVLVWLRTDASQAAPLVVVWLRADASQAAPGELRAAEAPPWDLPCAANPRHPAAPDPDWKPAS
eukprot:CAMPEP_0206528898 /NCGR_PEP_ID=MMETSP0325_2-20121206/2263_1 /ASSEMBLY_ACC=CAM_ASM_000347 /TAXON_ID=2866 /ORGANISM="Crypthecodinium cohnii, Strain Seligo" /LENGTH=115 /DNA_ID=CAMNT_0054024677 /DNA_START=804 /DNA_END=1150 /DNA_ORIENTATION=-